ncbi:MAG: RNA polymerase sigma factor [Planctomycetota bacterium]
MAHIFLEKNACSKNMNSAKKIFSEYGDFIYGVIRFNIRNEFEAEDVYHDIFLHLISKPLPKDIRNMKCFLYKVVSDRIKDAMRKIDRYNRRIQRYAQNSIRYDTAEPEDPVIDREETEKMFSLMQKNLSPKEAKAITLRYIKDDKISSVAEKMGIQKRSVSRYISVGLKKVRAVMKANEGRVHD